MSRRRRFLGGWAGTVLALGLLGAGLAVATIVRDQLPLLDAAGQARLIVSWGVVGALAGALLGLVNGTLCATLRGRGGTSLAVFTGTAAIGLAIGAGRAYDSPLWQLLGEPAAYPPLPAEPVRPDAPNLVLVSIDTLRRANLGLHGYGRDTSPGLDEFARGGVVFETAIAQAPATLRSMASLVTGLYPWAMDEEFSRRGENGPFLGSGFHTLAERLSAQGYDTAGFVSNGYLKGANGFAQGFAHWDDTSGMYGEGNAGRARRAQHVVEPATAWLEGATPPFFLWVHATDPHHPYEPAAVSPWEDLAAPRFSALARTYSKLSIDGYTRRLHDLVRERIPFESHELEYLIGRYDGEIAQVDAGISALARALRAHGYDDSNTVVVVTADHGEEFMEHGRLMHSFTLYDEMIRVPLILRGPRIPAGERVSAQVRLIDVAPTLLELAGAERAGLDGDSLLGDLERSSWLSRPAVSVRSTKYVSYRTPTRKLVVAFEPYPSLRVGWVPPWAIVSMAEIAFGRDRRSKIGLWHLDADPAEKHDRLTDSSAEAQRLYEALLRERLRRGLRAVPLDQGLGGLTSDVAKQLRALGYAE